MTKTIVPMKRLYLSNNEEWYSPHTMIIKFTVYGVFNNITISFLTMFYVELITMVLVV